MTNLSHPMKSCEIAYSWNIGGRFKLLERSTHVIKPRLRRYRRSRSFTLGCVPVLSIHFSALFVDCRNTAAQPASGQQAMCLHVCCICGSLGIEGSARPGETRTSLCLLCQVHVLTPIVEIALVNCEVCCGQTSSQLH
jgi:hypothetical protein